LTNFYQILGLPNFAASGEVKNAFRRLAKLYHPDINPVGQEHFKTIVKAYEILSDHYKKTQYDYRLKSHLNSLQKNLSPKKDAKTYDFTDAELKRRSYYQENYKKHYEQSQAKQPIVELKRSNNEFKNIIIATPLAVLLIMLVLNVWNNKPEMKVVRYKEEPIEIVKTSVEETRRQVSTGDSPYAEYYGGARHDTVSKRSIKFKNMCGNDLILFLFHQKKFIRSCYVEHGFEVDLKMLPKEISLVRIMQGKNFEYIKELSKAGVFGAFKDDCKFYQYKKKLKLDGSNSLTLLDFAEQGFEEVGEEIFFKKDG
jgi:curved DNA-binding protein CbpA